LADPKNKLNSSALGKYQFTKSTLFGSGKDVGEIARLGISKDEKFTPELQDRLALALIGKQTEQFKKGSISQSQYQNVLAGRWASIARADTGLSQYRQRVGTTSSDLAEILPGIKSAPPGSPTYAKASVGGEGTYNVNRTNILARIRREKQALPGYTGAGPLQAPPGYPVYAKAPTGGEGNYSINVTVNAQTNASPKEIADETQKAIIKSSRDMKREKTIRDRVGASS
jgi:hypothetical protein